jgi:tape measure domain-containing protein
MTNSIEFILRLKNLMGGELTKVGSTSQSTFTRMAKHVDQVSQRNKILGSSINEVDKQMKNVEATVRTSTIPQKIAQAKRELQSLYQQTAVTQRGISGGGGMSMPGRGIGIQGMAIGSMLGGIYTQALGMITSGAGAVISESFKKETAITGLKTFLGEQGANEAYKNIRQDANITPFDTESLLMVNRSLISAGENAVAARSTSLDLANAIAAVGGGNDELGRMAANMQQIKTVGKATAMDIRQFGMTGINIYEMLAKSTGKNIEQVKEMEVTYEQLQAALAMSRASGGMYEGAMEAQSNTKSGKWNTMKDNFMTAAADVGDAFSPIINKLLDIGVRFANSISPALQMVQPYITMFADWLGVIIDYVSNIGAQTGGWTDYLAIAQQTAGVIWEVLKQVGVAVWRIVGSIIEFVMNSQIIKDIFWVVSDVIQRVFTIISWIVDKLLLVWENVVMPLLKAVDDVYKYIKGFFAEEKNVTVNVKAKPTGIPKSSASQSTVFATSKMSASNQSAGRSAGESVVGGGPKTINISVAKFFDNIQFTTMNGSESAQELEKIVLETLARVIYNGSKLA